VGQRCRRPGGEGGGRQLTSAPAIVVDLSGAEELCSEPAPLERVRRAYAELPRGRRLEVHTPIAEHAFAVRAWSRKSGIVLLDDRRENGVHVLVLAPPA
jgi:TusA-related sulfurtransferase